MYRNFYIYLLIFLWLVLLSCAIFLRPNIAISEPRYLSVAWEMWLNGNHIVPARNGGIYAEKPPLLFWLMNIGWHIFGVNDWWPKIITALFGLGTLFMTTRVAEILFPNDNRIADFAPFTLLSIPMIAAVIGFIAFDVMMMFWVLFGIWGILKAYYDAFYKGWIMLAFAIGFGILTKGPVIFVYLLPIILLTPLWDTSQSIKEKYGYTKWYIGFLFSVLLGAVIAAIWVVPAAILGGEEYRNIILFKQSMGRVVNSFAHQKPFWWYVVFLIPFLLPWSMLPNLWRLLFSAKTYQHDMNMRFLCVWIGASIILFSLISGKQITYLFPIFPALAILFMVAIIKYEGFYDKVFSWCVGFLMISMAGLLIFAYNDPFDLIKAEEKKLIEPYWTIIIFACGYAAIRFSSSDIEQKTIRNSVFIIIAMIGFLMTARPILYIHHDISNIAQEIKKYQDSGYEVAHIGPYKAPFHFAGRLQKPLIILPLDTNIKQWIDKNPNAIILSYRKEIDKNNNNTLYVAPYRGRYIILSGHKND